MSSTDLDQTIAKIEVDRELCIGAATCVALAPEVFALDQENKAVVLPNHQGSPTTILNAAKSCLVYAIYLYNQSGQKMYPTPDTGRE